MRFVVFEKNLGVVVGDEVYITKVVEPGSDPIREALESGVDLVALGRSTLEQSDPQPLPERLDPPIGEPSKVIAVGLNYRDHCRETNTPLPEFPIEFAKHPSSLTGHMHPIPVDDGLTTEADYEVELAVIIGEPCRDLDATDALDVVAGYTVANDVTARDLQVRDGQWVRSKSFDGFTPLGPTFVTADEIADPQSIALKTWLDGELVQDSSTSEMVFPVSELLAFVSRRTTLLSGDILLTGTPHGIGAFHDPPIYLRPGSTVECSIEGIGTLTNPVIDY